MSAQRHEFYPLYLARFANSFGAVTLLTLLPTYIDLWDPSGLVVGLFTTALTIASTAAVFPISWAGDRFDKRTVLLVALGLSAVTYAGFALVDGNLQFIGARFLQGFALVGTGMVSLAVVGELAGAGTRAKYIGQANAWRMAAGVIAPLGVGALYARYGFGAIYALLVGVLLVAGAGVWLFIDPDETTVTGFALADLAVNERILTLTSFRAQYAVAVTLIRTWVPIYAGIAAARGGLALSAFAVGATITAEKVTNMIGQPLTGRVSDQYGRSLFVFAGGTAYGLVGLTIPLTPHLAEPFHAIQSLPLLSTLPLAVFPLLALNGLLGIADSFREPASMALFADEGEGQGITSAFGVRSLVWRPGQMVAPLLGGWLMDAVGMQWVFYVGGVTAVLGALTFLGVLTHTNGTDALTEW